MGCYKFRKEIRRIRKTGDGNKMTKKQKLHPEVLKALRETSGYSIEEIAKKLNTSIKKIISVEEGKELFTLAQIKKLADIYRRPLAAFFSSSIPELPEIHIYFDTEEKGF